MANAEIRGYDSELRFGAPLQELASSAARKTQLWNAAANDEVHLTQDGQLTQAMPFPVKMHQIDENPADDDVAVTTHVRKMVEKAGSEAQALANAAKEEERLKAELGEKKMAETLYQLQQQVAQQRQQHQQLLKEIQEEEQKKRKKGDKLTQVEIAEDPAKLLDCLERLQKDDGMSPFLFFCPPPPSLRWVF